MPVRHVPPRELARLVYTSPRFQKMFVAMLLVAAAGVASGFVPEGSPWWWRIPLWLIFVWQMFVLIRLMWRAIPHGETMKDLMRQMDRVESDYWKAFARKDDGLAERYRKAHDELVDEYREERSRFLGHEP